MSVDPLFHIVVNDPDFLEMEPRIQKAILGNIIKGVVIEADKFRVNALHENDRKIGNCIMDVPQTMHIQTNVGAHKVYIVDAVQEKPDFTYWDNSRVEIFRGHMTIIIHLIEEV